MHRFTVKIYPHSTCPMNTSASLLKAPASDGLVLRSGRKTQLTLEPWYTLLKYCEQCLLIYFEKCPYLTSQQ